MLRRMTCPAQCVAGYQDRIRGRETDKSHLRSRNMSEMSHFRSPIHCGALALISISMHSVNLMERVKEIEEGHSNEGDGI